jgi:alcohol dehydrogenase class IV
MRFNASHAADLYAEIAADAFPDLAKEAGTDNRCLAFIDALAALSASLGLKTRLRDVGVGEQHIPQMAKDAMKQERLLVNNPRQMTESDALAIYRAAW